MNVANIVIAATTAATAAVSLGAAVINFASALADRRRRHEDAEDDANSADNIGDK